MLRVSVKKKEKIAISSYRKKREMRNLPQKNIPMQLHIKIRTFSCFLMVDLQRAAGQQEIEFTQNFYSKKKRFFLYLLFLLLVLITQTPITLKNYNFWLLFTLTLSTIYMKNTKLSVYLEFKNQLASNGALKLYYKCIKIMKINLNLKDCEQFI